MSILQVILVYFAGALSVIVLQVFAINSFFDEIRARLEQIFGG